MMNPQLLVGALQLAAHLGQCQQEHDKERALAELKNSALANMLDVLVTKRVDAVQAGFNRILDGFAEQARHLMAQQSKYTDAMIAAGDARKRVELGSMIASVNAELGLLRADTQHLYERMTDVILAIGGKGDHFAAGLAPVLELQAPDRGM
jgi:hypothetical protein